MILTGIFIYPAKSLRAVARQDAAVTARGLENDRRWLVTDAHGQFVTQRQIPGLARLAAIPTAAGLELWQPGGESLTIATPGPDAERRQVTIWRDHLEASAAGPAADEFISRACGHACHLVYMAEAAQRQVNPKYARPGDLVSFADGFPILICTAESMADLNRRLARPIDISRFRPNLVIAGATPWEEDNWKSLRIGEVILQIAKPCERCVVTTIDQQSGLKPDPKEPLRTLAKFRRDAENHVLFGQNAIPRQLGRVRIGDIVDVL